MTHEMLSSIYILYPDATAKKNSILSYVPEVHAKVKFSIRILNNVGTAVVQLISTSTKFSMYPSIQL